MAKNDFLARQRQREQDVFDAGMRIWWQQMCDYITLALRDPAVMGKDTFGAKRIVAVLQGVKRLMDEFHPAFDKCDEADYYQEKLDRLLRELTATKSRKGSLLSMIGMSA